MLCIECNNDPGNSVSFQTNNMTRCEKAWQPAVAFLPTFRLLHFGGVMRSTGMDVFQTMVVGRFQPSEQSRTAL